MLEVNTHKNDNFGALPFDSVWKYGDLTSCGGCSDSSINIEKLFFERTDAKNTKRNPNWGLNGVRHLLDSI